MSPDEQRQAAMLDVILTGGEGIKDEARRAARRHRVRCIVAVAGLVCYPGAAAAMFSTGNWVLGVAYALMGAGFGTYYVRDGLIAFVDTR